jgi:hypothetical protein
MGAFVLGFLGGVVRAAVRIELVRASARSRLVSPRSARGLVIRADPLGQLKGDVHD